LEGFKKGDYTIYEDQTPANGTDAEGKPLYFGLEDF
jgi:hypothetical protein